MEVVKEFDLSPNAVKVLEKRYLKKDEEHVLSETMAKAKKLVLDGTILASVESITPLK